MPRDSAVERIFDPISRHFRRRRSRLFLRVMPDFAQRRVLDLGGSINFWEKLDRTLVPADLTILNLADDLATASLGDNPLGLRVELYDGERLPFPDRHFDAVLCNSVIEHVLPEARPRFVAEMLRVARYVFVQTPAVSFPIEPHFLMPAVHWLPRPVARRLVRFSPVRFLAGAPPDFMSKVFDEIHLLPLPEFQAFLPFAAVEVERFAGLPKSYTLHGAPP